MGHIANRRLWLADDRTTVVEDGDPRASFLLAAGPGDEIPLEEAERVGLVAPVARSVLENAARSIDNAFAEAEGREDAEPEVQDKAVRGPLQPPRHGGKQ